MNRIFRTTTISSLIFIIFFANFIFSSAVFAYGFDKMRLSLSFKSPIDSLILNNNASQPLNSPKKVQNTPRPVILKIKAMRWTQTDGKDVYAAAQDLVISPQVLTIPVNQQQTVRVAWRSPQPLKTELAYRFILSDLTPINPKKEESSENVISTNIVIRFKVDMPIFISPENPEIEAQWFLEKAPNNQLKLIVKNTGNVHLQIKNLRLVDTKNQEVAASSRMFYALASFLTVKKSMLGVLTLTAETDAGKKTAVLSLQ